MNRTFSKSVILFVVVAALAALVVPAYAQQTQTRTITEDQINQTYWVTSNPRRAIDDLAVDLQPGQAVISATFTLRGQDPANTRTTMIPTLSNGRVIWEVSSVLVNGEPAPAAWVDQVNAAIASSWRVYVGQNRAEGRIVDVTLTDTELIYTFEGRGNGDLPGVIEDGSVSFTEDQINQSYRVTNNPRRTVDDIVVDLQPGQVVIDATITLRGQDPVATRTTMIPTISNGRVIWEVTSILANGEPASQDLIDQVNASIVSSWRVYIGQQRPEGWITAVTITDTDITYILENPRSGN